MFRQETVSGGETILTAMGSIGGETAVEFRRRLESIAAGRATTVTLDLTQATGMTSAAIGMILALRKKLVEQKKVLRIQGCSDQLLSIFKMIKLDTIIPIQR
jgi:anti-anti-sigma factor